MEALTVPVSKAKLSQRLVCSHGGGGAIYRGSVVQLKTSYARFKAVPRNSILVLALREGLQTDLFCHVPYRYLAFKEKGKMGD